MCLFFKQPKTKDVYEYFEKTWKAADIPGFPLKSARNYDNFKVSPYNTLTKNSCSCCIKVTYGKWRLDFTAYYHKDKKDISFSIWFMNLTISNPKLESAIRDTYKDFKFGFLPSAVTITPKKDYVAKKMEHIEDAFNSFLRLWKNSDLFSVMSSFKNNDELKKEGKIK